jgi:hypothetical protein
MSRENTGAKGAAKPVSPAAAPKPEDKGKPPGAPPSAPPAPSDLARGDDLSMTLDSIKIDSVIAGPMVSDPDLKGKVVLIEFWGIN